MTQMQICQRCVDQQPALAFYAAEEVLYYARPLGEPHERGTGSPDGTCYPEQARPENCLSQRPPRPDRN